MGGRHVRNTYTDLTITIVGEPVGDEAWEMMARTVNVWAASFGWGVLFETQSENRDGETWGSVKAERDALREYIRNAGIVYPEGAVEIATAEEETGTVAFNIAAGLMGVGAIGCFIAAIWLA